MVETQGARARLLLCTGLALLSVGLLGFVSGGPFASIHVAANRPAYNGRGCPIEILYTATINFEMPHGPLAFNYHWERSDHAKGPMQVVRVPANQRSMVLHETWTLGAPGRTYDAWVRLYVNSGNTHLSEISPVVHVVCR